MEINIDQCMGCGNCIPHCPYHLLTLSTKRNSTGVRHIVNSDSTKCINCGICELMCTAGVITTPIPSGHDLIDPKAIPPHAGCYLGSLTKALADVVKEMDIQNQVSLFKVKASDVNFKVDIHDYSLEGDHFADALQFKKDHPKRIVIIITSSSKDFTTAKNEERLLSLTNQSVTIINTLNFFEANEAFTEVTRGGSGILERLQEEGKASYVARGSVRSPQQMNRLKKYLKTALQNQIEGKTFSVVEMLFPCFYRLVSRPQVMMEYEKIQQLNQFFDSCIAPDYTEFEH